MSLFTDLTVRSANQEACSEQFLVVLPMQLQKDDKKITAEVRSQ